jgi:hypothetical protein
MKEGKPDHQACNVFEEMTSGQRHVGARQIAKEDRAPGIAGWTSGQARSKT